MSQKRSRLALLIAAAGLLLAAAISCSGCWDRRELEERRWVLALGVDAAEGEDGKTVLQPRGAIGIAQPRYRLSLQVLNIVPIKDPSGISRGENSTYVLTAKGEALSAMLYEILEQVSQKLFLEHVQTAIISEAALRQGGIQPIFDFLQRERHLRVITHVLLTSKSAQAVLEYQPPDGEAGGLFISNMIQQYRQNPHILGYQSSMRDIGQAGDAGRDVLLGRVETDGIVLKIGGAALCRDGQPVAYLDEKWVQWNNFFTGREKAAVIMMECPLHPGKTAVLEVFEIRRQFKAKVQPDHIEYALELAVRANLGEMKCRMSHGRLGVEELTLAEAVLMSELQQELHQMFRRYQKLQYDPGVFEQALKAAAPERWMAVKDTWPGDAFAQAELTVRSKVEIYNVGGHD